MYKEYKVNSVTGDSFNWQKDQNTEYEGNQRNKGRNHHKEWEVKKKRLEYIRYLELARQKVEKSKVKIREVNTMLEEDKKMDKEQKHMKHITGMEKDGIANGK